MLSRFLRPTGSRICVKLVRCVSGEATAPRWSEAFDRVGKLSEDVFQREQKFGAHNYHPLPVALCKAQGRWFTPAYRRPKHRERERERERERNLLTTSK